MVPPNYVSLFNSIAAQRGDGSVVLPFPIWREAFINDADLETAQRAYDVLNPHPVKTFTDKISLKTNPADMKPGKIVHQLHGGHLIRHHYPWHPRLSQKLDYFGWFRCPEVMSFAFPTPLDLLRPLWMRDATNVDVMREIEI